MDNKNNPTVSSERYRVYIATHKGLVRDNNEDNFTVNNVSKKLEIKNVKFVSEHDAPMLTSQRESTLRLSPPKPPSSFMKISFRPPIPRQGSRSW